MKDFLDNSVMNATQDLLKRWYNQGWYHGTMSVCSSQKGRSNQIESKWTFLTSNNITRPFSHPRAACDPVYASAAVQFISWVSQHKGTMRAGSILPSLEPVMCVEGFVLIDSDRGYPKGAGNWKVSSSLLRRSPVTASHSQMVLSRDVEIVELSGENVMVWI